LGNLSVFTRPAALYGAKVFLSRGLPTIADAGARCDKIFSNYRGVPMKRNLFSPPFLLVVAVFALNSCSGPAGGGVTPPPPGNGKLSLVLKVIPPAPTSGLSLLSFAGNITGISLTPSSGSPVNVTLNATTFTTEFTRFTSDAGFLATVSAPAGTYTGITVVFGAPVATFCTQPTPGIAGCATTPVQVSGAVGSNTITTSLTVTSNQNTGIAINVDLSKAITASGQTISAVNLGATGVFTTSTIPGTSDLTGTHLAHIDDIFGVVTSINASTKSVTVQTATRGSITATEGSSAVYDPACSVLKTGTTFAGCVAVNQVVSLDAILNSDGTFTYTYYDPLDTAAEDFIEGVVTVAGNSTTKQFTLVTTDVSVANTGSLLAGKLSLGDRVVVTLSNPRQFFIDNKGLFVPANSFGGANDASVVLPGETILVHLTAFTVKNGTTPAAATSDGLALRFTRVTGTVATTGSPIFSANNLAPFFGISTNAQVEFTNGFTSFDGYTDATQITVGDSISTRALFFGPGITPSYSAGTIRKH
jgi:hypothetical protein